MKWFDTLFARIFLLQVAVALLLSLLFLLLLFSGQASVFARSVAPGWASALRPVQVQLAQGAVPQLPRSVGVATSVHLEPGPPPARARHIAATPLAPRYVALKAALRDEGIGVGRMAVSGEPGGGVTWLELLPTGHPPTWVGVHGALEGPGLRGRGALGIALAVLVFLGAAAWLSRIIVKPLLDLQTSVKTFAETGERPAAPPVRGPIEVRQLTQQFDDFAAQRVQQDDARQMMLAGISHDLRSPLGRIRMAAELLPDAPGVAARRESIVRNAQVADQLVGSFLSLVRSATEPLEERVDLAALVRDLLGHGDHGDVTLELQAAGPIWLEPASGVLLQRALINLLDNARHHGRPPVVVRLQADGGHATLTVRDHGPGIAPEQRETLLRPFYRGASDRGVPGTGLGLPVVERCVRRHGGEMQLLDAAPGLAVRLRFPLAGRPPSV